MSGDVRTLSHDTASTARSRSREPRPAGRGLSDRIAGVPTWQLLSVICGASAVTVVLLGTRLTFFNDDWYFLLQRPGLSAESVFAPHNGHLSALAVLIYKGLVALAGMESQLPFRLVLAATLAGLGIVVYALVSERAGRLLGLVAASLILFLGTAWEDLLWSFQIGLIGSLATGLAALLALERDSLRRNAVACGALVCSVLLSDLGIPFVVGATIAIALRRRAAQLWIPGVPGVLFGIWWVTYGSDAPSGLSWTNLRGLPEYMVDSAASGLAAITGRSGESWLWWGRALLVAVSIGGLVSVVRRRRVSLWLLVFLGTALSFWVLAGANYIPGREPVASRYQLFNAALLILMAAELFRPVRLSPRQTAAVLLIALIAFALNLNALRGGYDFMREQSGYAKAGIGALEIARGKTAPTFQLLEPVAQNPYLSGVQAARYFNATAAHGAPATYSPVEIAAADPAQRQAADHVLAAGYEIKLEPARGATSRGRCRRARPIRRGGTVDVQLPAGGAWVTNVGDRPFVIGVRRFAARNLPVSLGSLSPHRTSHLSIPRDSAARPWHLAAHGSSELQVCRG